MIRQLYIENYAVIDKINIAFQSGLNLLTGETGSGKSIIVDAIGIALGERADSDAVRSGTDKAIVEIVLEIPDTSETVKILDEAGYRSEDGSIIISRELNRNGKSQCRINGRPATVSMIKSITDHLIDTHGQHEHQSLLKTDNHLPILDAWCGANIIDLRSEISSGYNYLSDIRNKLAQIKSNERDRVHLIDLYQYQKQEIDQAKLVSGEDNELTAERNRLGNAEKLQAAVSEAFDILSDRNSDNCVLDKLGDAVIGIEDIRDIDSELVPISENLQSALYLIEDAARELRSYSDAIEFNPEKLKETDDRLDLIRMLKRKYGDSIDEIIEYGNNLTDKLDTLLNNEELSAGYENELAILYDELKHKSMLLSEARKTGANKFKSAIENELAGLSMPNAKFDISFKESELNNTGTDDVEFCISANPGEAPKPLAKIASGGEISRVMLAIKSVMSEIDQIPTLIFDEIDVGIGGRTAEVVADKLAKLSHEAQIICITHLPQVACKSGTHFAIEKHQSNGNTIVSVSVLSKEERINEISRMLGGVKPTDTAIRHAKEMLGYI